MNQVLIISLVLISSVSFAQNAEYFNNKAINYGREGAYEIALQEINKAINLDSLNSEYLSTKGLYLTKLERFQSALISYSKAIEFDANPEAYEGRGIVYDKIGRFDLAIEDHTQAILKAKSEEAKYTGYSNRASAKMGKRDFQGAYEDLILAYSFDSTNLYVLTNLGYVCDEIGKGQETLTYLFKAIELDSSFYPAYANIGFKYQEMEQHENAIHWFNKLLEYDENEPLGYSNRSYSKLKLGNLDGALSDINKSIELNPENSYAYRTKALIYLEEGKIDIACENLQIAIEKGFAITYGNEVLNLQKENCK